MKRPPSEEADLTELIAKVAEMPDRRAAAAAIASLIRSYGSYRWVGIYEVGEEEIYVLAWSGPSAPSHPRFPRSAGICGRAVLSRAMVCVDDVTKDPDYLTTLNSTRSEIVVPVLATNVEPLGLIDVESEDVAAFSTRDRDVLLACASAARRLWPS
jgi:putative methionine-R-sulfoxide reductase with GAF domain